MKNRYRLQQWTEIIRDCRSSGQTVVRWCADHEVNVKSYYYWLKKSVKLLSTPFLLSPPRMNQL
jgi:hypothetical protein